MALYKFTLEAAARTLVYNGFTTAFVEATSEAAALVLLKAQSTEDVDSIWDAATATLISQDIEGVVFTVATSAPVVSVSYTALSGDTWTDVGTALAALLVAEDLFATWTPNATHSSLYGTLVIATGDANAAVTAVAIVAGGTAYTASDTLTVAGGTSATAATLTVTTEAAGVVTVIAIAGAGDYTVLPANPVSVTGGTGSGATFTLTWDADNAGAATVTQTVLDPAANDVASEHTGNVVDGGTAQSDLSMDITAGGSGSYVVGMFG